MSGTIGLGMMVKPPRPGVAKTRLAQSLGNAMAAALAEAFLRDTAAVAEEASRAHGLAIHAYYRPADGAAELAAILGPSWPLTLCDEGELGLSMLMALGHMLERHKGGALLMGCDLPDLPPALLAEAVAQLRALPADGAVFGPTEDGGYWLVGFRSLAPAPLLAPMAWSTPTVMAETRRRAAAASLPIVTLPLWHDIDNAADLERLRHVPAGVAPATRRVLADREGW